MKIIRRFKFSIAFLLVLTTIVGFITSRVVEMHAQVTRETKTFEALREHGIGLTETKPAPNLAERVLGIQLQPSEFRASLKHDQNRYLYDLTKLSNLKALNITLRDNLPNLMMFSHFDKLENLCVSEWYTPESMDGVQLLSHLKHLEVWDTEADDEIDLTALADHPTLEEFQIGDYPLDKSKNFQVLPDFN